AATGSLLESRERSNDACRLARGIGRYDDGGPSRRPARWRSALSPGRKKYAPPLTVVNAGIPLIRFLIGRFGILNSSVPSCVPMIGSRSLPSSWKFLSLIHMFCANSNWRIRLAEVTTAAIPRSTPSSGADSGSGGPYGAPRRIIRGG